MLTLGLVYSHNALLVAEIHVVPSMLDIQLGGLPLDSDIRWSPYCAPCQVSHPVPCTARLQLVPCAAAWLLYTPISEHHSSFPISLPPLKQSNTYNIFTVNHINIKENVLQWRNHEGQNLFAGSLSNSIKSLPEMDSREKQFPYESTLRLHL